MIEELCAPGTIAVSGFLAAIRQWAFEKRCNMQKESFSTLQYIASMNNQDFFRYLSEWHEVQMPAVDILATGRGVLIRRAQKQVKL